MCSLEFPDLQPLQDAYADDGLVVIGVAAGTVGETDALLREFRDQTGVTFPIARDDGSKAEFAWPQSISPYPRQALIGRDGVVVHLSIEHQPGILAQQIEAAVAR